jgi:hypothetical protein
LLDLHAIETPVTQAKLCVVGPDEALDLHHGNSSALARPLLPYLAPEKLSGDSTASETGSSWAGR